MTPSTFRTVLPVLNWQATMSDLTDAVKAAKRDIKSRPSNSMAVFRLAFLDKVEAKLYDAPANGNAPEELEKAVEATKHELIFPPEKKTAMRASVISGALTVWLLHEGAKYAAKVNEWFSSMGEAAAGGLAMFFGSLGAAVLIAKMVHNKITKLYAQKCAEAEKIAADIIERANKMVDLNGF